MIYLIGKTGAATTNDDGMAHAMETIASYRRCTKDEYYEHLRKIKAVDMPATGITIDIEIRKDRDTQRRPRLAITTRGLDQ